MHFTKSERATLDFTYSTVFFTLFKVKDKLNIKLCQFYSGCLPPSCRLDIKKLNFVNALQFLKNSMPMQLIAIGGREEFVSLANKYKLASYDRGFLIKSKCLNGLHRIYQFDFSLLYIVTWHCFMCRHYSKLLLIYLFIFARVCVNVWFFLLFVLSFS